MLPTQVNLVDWLKSMVAERRVEEVLDPRLPENPPSKALKRVVLAALRCVDPDGGQRPTMAHVVHMLEDDQILRDVCQYIAMSFHFERLNGFPKFSFGCSSTSLHFDVMWSIVIICRS